MKPGFFFIALWYILFCSTFSLCGQNDNRPSENTRIIRVGMGWARTSVNAVIFRQNSVVSHGEIQYTAYYDPEGTMVLAKRTLGSGQWTVRETPYSGNVRDAHNSISIAVDGNGILHIAWNHHDSELHYVQSMEPGGLSLSPRLPMTGKNERAVSYPQFYALAGGDLLFVYREGSSGNGNIMINRYDADQKRWDAISHPLIDGEGERNAYINTLAIDRHGSWHISWTWRETRDAATNHDILYAWSPDEGETWLKSDGEKYNLPITAGNAQVVCVIPRGNELINQTSMTITDSGEPVIATYWKPKGASAPQFHIVWQDKDQWKIRQAGKRSQSFSLSGSGTKRIPVSRPQILSGSNNDLYLVFRDFERGGGISVAISSDPNHKQWTVQDIYAAPVGMWEPSFDPVIWVRKRELHLFAQKVGQGDGETMENIEAQEVFILKWTPPLYRD